MPKIIADSPNSLNSVLNDEIARSGTDGSSIVTAALARYLKTPPSHSLPSVDFRSTSGWRLCGGSQRAGLLEHGDFGLETFANLDIEIVVLDSRVYQVQSTGRILEALLTARAPFRGSK
jgi:acetolactate decarboxylase